MSITVVIHTYNEERNIVDCIASAKLVTDRIVVVDMESTDRTRDLVKQEGASVVMFPHSDYVEPAREFGIKQAKTDWVFIMDADERMTEKLAQEIRAVLTLTDSVVSHYQISRKNIFGATKWLKHGGWWPDYQTRLINKTDFRSWPKIIHSTPVIDGERGRLQNPLIHLFHGDLEKMVKKTIVFEDIESELLHKAGRSASTPIFFRKFLGELNRRLIRDRGFLDGTVGIIEGIYQAFSKTITYLFLYEKNKRKSSSL